MEHPVEGTGPHTICPKFACPSQNFHTYPNESNPDMIGIRRLRPLQGEHLRCQRAREGQHKRRGGERRHHRALVHQDGRLLQGSVHQSRPEKTREVTRPGQAGLSKILSLSAVPARRVTRSEGNPQARATHEPGQKVVGLL